MKRKSRKSNAENEEFGMTNEQIKIIKTADRILIRFRNSRITEPSDFGGRYPVSVNFYLNDPVVPVFNDVKEGILTMLKKRQKECKVQRIQEEKEQGRRLLKKYPELCTETEPKKATRR